MPIKPSTRPESYSELITRSLRLYKTGLPSVFLFALLASMVVFIPRLISVAVGQNVFLTTTKVNQVALLYLAMYLSLLWFTAAILWGLNCIERNNHKNFIVDFEMAGKRILYVFGAALCFLFIITLIGLFAFSLNKIFWFWKLFSYDKYLASFLLFIVLFGQFAFTVWMVTLFYFYFPLIVIEHDGIFLAFKQSAQLVKNQVGKTLALQLTPWIVYIIALVLVRIIFKVNLNVYFMPKDPVSTLYPTLLHIFILAFFIPWECSMILVQLRDLELRKITVLPQKNDLSE